MTNNTSTNRRRGIVTALRDLMPRRPLALAESLRLAELQANRLLEHFGCQSPPFSDELIASLPRITVEYTPNLINHGMTEWRNGVARIAIRSADSETRQRFTLAHELKHVLDARIEDAIYGHLPKGTQRRSEVEAICNYFAACLLMPKRWIKRAWFNGMQDVFSLAWYFEVSPQAMQIRLQTLGLLQPIPRCGGLQRLGGPVVKATRKPGVRRYYRHARIRVHIEPLMAALGRTA